LGYVVSRPHQHDDHVGKRALSACFLLTASTGSLPKPGYQGDQSKGKSQIAKHGADRLGQYYARTRQKVNSTRWRRGWDSKLFEGLTVAHWLFPTGCESGIWRCPQKIPAHEKIGTLGRSGRIEGHDGLLNLGVIGMTRQGTATVAWKIEAAVTSARVISFITPSRPDRCPSQTARLIECRGGG
jgi:hypothetical protein